MPLLSIVHVLVAVYFAVHAVRTGRNMYWLLILLMLPFLGSVVYFFAEYLPELRHSPRARRAAGAVGRTLDPGRELRDAEQAFERTPTVDNRHRLAEALLARGRVDEALSHLEACVAGPYAHDVKLRLALARAQAAAGRHAQGAATLEALFADAPDTARGEPALLLAQCLSHVDEARALAAFDRACQLHAGIETNSAYGLYLARIGRTAAARALLERVLHDARLGTSYSRQLNREAIEQARAAMRALETAGH